MLLGVNPWTVANWEKGKTSPAIEHWPKLLDFLVYDPFPVPRTLGEHIQQELRERGISIKVFAKEIGMDEKTLSKITREEYGVIDPRVRTAYIGLEKRYFRT